MALVADVERDYGLPCVLVVIDTLSRAMAGGDENAAKDMTAFVGNIDAVRTPTGAHCMVIHHTGKDSARGARGHSSLRAATDTEIEVAVANAADKLSVATVTKQRDMPGGEKFHFRVQKIALGLSDEDEQVTSAVAVPAEAPAAKLAAAAADDSWVAMLANEIALKGKEMEGAEPDPGWTASDLVQLYATKRISVIYAIHASATDRMRSFASAFKIKDRNRRPIRLRRLPSLRIDQCVLCRAFVACVPSPA